MTDFHVRVKGSEIEVWRTVRSLGGSRIRLDSKPVIFEGKAGLDKSLQIFQPGRRVLGRPGESNDRNSE